MVIVATHIELRTNLINTALSLSNVERFDDGSGYRCDVAVRSSGFACNRPFYFHQESLDGFVTSVQVMTSGTPAEATLKPRYEPDFLRLKMNQLGHLLVSGELYEHSRLHQCLKFAFETDQTVLGPFLCELLKLKEAWISRPP